MDRCNTCRHWEPYRTAYPRGGGRGHEAAGGLCRSGKMIEELGSDDYGTDNLVYPYYEGGRFWTGPEFGCVHHAPVVPL